MDKDSIENSRTTSLMELAKINVAVSEARANLEQLKKEQDNYLDIREKGAKERIEKLLDESKDIFNEIALNNTELIRFTNQLNDYVSYLKLLIEDTRKYSDDFAEKLDNGHSYFEQKFEELQDVKKQLLLDRSNILAGKEELRISKEKLLNEQKELFDKRQAFERAWAEVKKEK